MSLIYNAQYSHCNIFYHVPGNECNWKYYQNIITDEIPQTKNLIEQKQFCWYTVDHLEYQIMSA
jgi:hypothetical protein